jgi:NAD(P)-dependent dehydrogenase (short-subunit alcohol dehydrogenase family)
MDPRPDYGETRYRGSGRLADRKAIVTGGDSSIGEAVALAVAREGADVLIAYHDKHEDALESAGRRAVLVPGDIEDPAHCRAVVEKAVAAFGRVDVPVINAAHWSIFRRSACRFVEENAAKLKIERASRLRHDREVLYAVAID